MYSLIKIILFTLVLYKTTEAAVSLLGPEKKPPQYADEEGCYLSILNLVLEVGIPYSPQDGSSCKKYMCNEDGGTLVYACASLTIGDGCEVVDGDKTLPYPKCCDKVICTKEDEDDE